MSRRLTLVVGDYPHTTQLLSRDVVSPVVDLQPLSFDPVRSAFAAMAERREFDVCEMALATYVQARGVGRPITLLPVTMSARFQHSWVFQDRRRRVDHPKELEGRRVALQSYAQTTGVWVRGILSEQYDVDLGAIEWVPLEETHVGGFERPANVVPAPAGSSMAQLLDEGLVDAAIVSQPLTGAPDAIPLFDDIESATQDWYRRTGVLQVNHVMCMGTDLVDDDPDAVAATLDLFWRARRGAGERTRPIDGAQWAVDVDPLPFGTTALAPVVELMRRLCIDQGLVAPDLVLADLVHEAMADLEPPAES